MVRYNARWEEFEKGVREAEERDYKQVSDKPEETLPITTRAAGLSKTLQTYMDWRDRALAEGLQILEEESTSITAQGQNGKWSAHFSKKGQEALKMILDAVKDYDKKAPNLRKFGEDVAGEESQFFARLSQMPLATMQGQLQQYALEFYKEMNSLEGKWKALGDQDRSIDDKMRETSKKILSIQEEAVKAFIGGERRMEDDIRTLAKKLKDAPSGTIPSSVKYPMQVVDWFLERLGALRTTTEEYTRKIQEFYRYEDTIVVMFTQTREMVREFLEKTNFAKAVKEHNDACKKAIELAGQCPTSRQRDDAKKFAEEGISKVEEFLEKFEDEYNEFISSNRGIFVGPVNEKSLEELLEVQERKQTWQEIERFNIQSRLQDMYKRCITIFDVDADGISEQQEKELKDFFKSEVERLGKGIVAASDDTVWSRTKSLLSTSQALLADKVKSSKGGEG